MAIWDHGRLCQASQLSKWFLKRKAADLISGSVVVENKETAFLCSFYYGSSKTKQMLFTFSRLIS